MHQCHFGDCADLILVDDREGIGPDLTPLDFFALSGRSGVLHLQGAVVYCTYRAQWCIGLSGRSGVLHFQGAVVHCIYRAQWCIAPTGRSGVLDFQGAVVYCTFRAQWCIASTGHSGVLHLAVPAWRSGQG